MIILIKRVDKINPSRNSKENNATAYQIKVYKESLTSRNIWRKFV